MAVYIPRNRLGSGQAGYQRERQLTQKIEAMPQFKALRNSLATAKDAQASKLSEKFEGNAEVQEWRRKTKEEQTRDAIDRMIPTTKSVIEHRTGKDCSTEDARKMAEGFAYKSERRKAGE